MQIAKSKDSRNRQMRIQNAQLKMQTARNQADFDYYKELLAELSKEKD